MVQFPMVFVLGLDLGSTATRVLLASPDGNRVGAGRAGGGNPTVHGEAAADALREALRPALARIDPALVVAGTLGCAGVGALDADPRVRAAFDSAWRQAGLTCPYAVVSDALVGFAAGTPAPDGAVLVAGTGAVAAAIHRYRPHRWADGHGWLLGDDGSGFWLGRQAVRVALAELDAHRPLGRLAREVLVAVLGTDTVDRDPRTTVRALVQRVVAGSPVALAELAPRVLCAGRDGDPVAAGVLDAAASKLAGSLGRVRPAGTGAPVVLAGGLLAVGSPLATRVRAILAGTRPDAPILTAGDGAAGAAFLAARDLPGADPHRLHARLVREGATQP